MLAGKFVNFTSINIDFSELDKLPSGQRFPEEVRYVYEYVEKVSYSLP